MQWTSHLTFKHFPIQASFQLSYVRLFLEFSLQGFSLLSISIFLRRSVIPFNEWTPVKVLRRYYLDVFSLVYLSLLTDQQIFIYFSFLISVHSFVRRRWGSSHCHEDQYGCREIKKIFIFIFLFVYLNNLKQKSSSNFSRTKAPSTIRRSI